MDERASASKLQCRRQPGFDPRAARDGTVGSKLTCGGYGPCHSVEPSTKERSGNRGGHRLDQSSPSTRLTAHTEPSFNHKELRKI
ncbi:hypothetical protein CCUS01_10905 [Colletotrichum cuscutae]|uniref:Uncharacterized protein n=1 Tax=Colletotrichum cuscutae TaxID=1209917 RepID=A0AAI9XLJ6_9PEZI|nr:hypothetical protein CCUS01_10905 [Colletotrichum cuscutae]